MERQNDKHKVSIHTGETYDISAHLKDNISTRKARELFMYPNPVGLIPGIKREEGKMKLGKKVCLVGQQFNNEKNTCALGTCRAGGEWGAYQPSLYKVSRGMGSGLVGQPSGSDVRAWNEPNQRCRKPLWGFCSHTICISPGILVERCQIHRCRK